MFCRKCDGTGMIGKVVPGQREFGGDASTWSEHPCPDCNPQPCPNCKDKIEQLQDENKKLKQGGYLRHKHNCFMGEYNTILIGKSCNCGLSKILKGQHDKA